MLTDRKGLSLLEYVVGGAIVIALLGVSVYSIATKANAEGGNVAAYIDGINVPSAP